MNTKQTVGAVLGAVMIVTGAYFMKSGYSSMDATKEKLKHKITGNYSSQTKNRIRMGMGLVVVGLAVGAGLIYHFRSRKKTH